MGLPQKYRDNVAGWLDAEDARLVHELAQMLGVTVADAVHLAIVSFAVESGLEVSHDDAKA